MIIYLAGGVSGNLKPFWDIVMKIYLAGSSTREYVITESMKLFLAGGNIGYKWSGDYNEEIIKYKPYILESYYYLAKHEEWISKLMPFFKGFLLDSGAFTFMSDVKNSKQVNWDLYVEKYAAFINKYNINLFFELDIDVLVGIQEVERLRKKLEALTKKKCIPVWHKSRGKEYWLRMIKEYNYVAIGGIVTREIKPEDYPFFSYFLKTAQQAKCKVHALGFTNLEGLKIYPFYSVDSTAWLSGNRFGAVYQFNGTSMVKTTKPDGQKVKGRQVAVHNFTEWVKFSNYAEQYL